MRAQTAGWVFFFSFCSKLVCCGDGDGQEELVRKYAWTLQSEPAACHGMARGNLPLAAYASTTPAVAYAYEPMSTVRGVEYPVHEWLL